ncbi:MAG: ribose ABC transporter permease [Desulfosarcinaceae bacterium]|nr:ribose ABC transporter permease [Desulfosarcinaceae bacterium]
MRGLIQRFSGLFILLALCLFLSFSTEYFLTQRNLVNIVLQTSILAIVALGVGMTMLTAGIDLSVGSVAAFCGAIAAGLIVESQLGIWLAIPVAVVAGISLGLLNGLLIVYGSLPPFIATLATMAIGRGLTLVYTDGRPITVPDPAFVFIGNGEVLGVPLPVIIMAALLLTAYLFLAHTRTGRNLYAIGGNEKTAHLAGISVARGKLLVYMISAFAAATAGIILTARLWSAQPTTGMGLELEAIAAAVLGGTSLFGGRGSAWGIMVGVFIIGVVSNGLNLLEISSYYQQVIKGFVFIMAVILDMYARKK